MILLQVILNWIHVEDYYGAHDDRKMIVAVVDAAVAPFSFGTGQLQPHPGHMRRMMLTS